jgi:hypothetical protein
MRYTNRTIIVSQSRLSEAEARVGKHREMVKKLEDARHPGDDAIALLLVMEQSLLSMKRFLSILERDLKQSLGAAEKARLQASRRRAQARIAGIAHEALN